MLFNRTKSNILVATALFGLTLGSCAEKAEIKNLEKIKLSTISVHNGGGKFA